MTEQELAQLLAKRIKRKMVPLHIDQRELARRVGITEASLSRYMKGQRKPTYNIIVKIAQALECRPGELIDIDERLD